MAGCCGGSGGCGCVILPGTGVSIDGTGSTATPYVISTDGGDELDDAVALLVLEDESASYQAMNDRFAAKSVQDAVETGYLYSSVLDDKYAVDSIYIGAGEMVLATGSPSNAPSNSHVPVWRLDASTDESASCSTKVPKAWATYDIHVIGHNGGAGAGAVRLRTLLGQYRDGDDVTADTDVDSVVFTAAAQNIRQTIAAHTDVPADPTRTVVIRVLRDADDASDTLANDWNLSGVELIATSYVQFEPDLPEPPEDLSGQAFTAADNALLDRRVMWGAPPPDDDAPDPNFKYYPGTDYATQNSDNMLTSTWSLGDKWYTVWAPRYNYGDVFNSQPNNLPSPRIDHSNGRECRTVYTTRAKAEAALQAIIRHISGNTSGTVQGPWVSAGGVAGDLIPEATLRSSPDTYFTTAWLNTTGSKAGTTYQVMVDKVCLPTAKLADGVHPGNTQGVRLDFEVQDNRTEAQTTALITDLTSTLHTAGYDLYFYTTTLNAGIRQYSGLGSNIGAIFDLVDFMDVFMWADNPDGNFQDSYDAQIALLNPVTTGDWAKVVVLFQIGSSADTTLADAEWVYDKLHEPGTTHPTFLEFWRSQAQMGGARNRLVNQKVEMATLGTYTP